MEKFCNYLQGLCKRQDSRSPLEEYMHSFNIPPKKMEPKYQGFACGDRISCLTTLPNNPEMVIAGTSEGEIYKHDCTDKTSTTSFKAHDKSITQIRHHVDDLYVTSSRDDTVKIWNDSGCSHTLSGYHELVITTVDSNNRDKNQIVTGSRDNRVALWDVENNKVLSSSQIARNVVTDLCWRENIIAQTSEDKSLRLFDSNDLTNPVHQFASTNHILTSCDINGDLIITSSGGFNSNGCFVTVWDRRHGLQPLYTMTGHDEKVHEVKFLSSDTAVSIGADNRVDMWELNDKFVQYCAYISYSAHCVQLLYIDENEAVFAVGTDEKGVQTINHTDFVR